MLPLDFPDGGTSSGILKTVRFDRPVKLQKRRQVRLIVRPSYLSSPEGRSHYQTYMPTFLDFYRTVEPDRFQDAARRAAMGKVEREHFQFPDFGVWLLSQRSPQS